MEFLTYISGVIIDLVLFLLLLIIMDSLHLIQADKELSIGLLIIIFALASAMKNSKHFSEKTTT